MLCFAAKWAVRDTTNQGDEQTNLKKQKKDMEGAKRAGMKFILFGSGWKPNSDFKPDGCFTDYSELLKILGEM
jgi:FMN phosphatase YigB (HAD superfamily)